METLSTLSNRLYAVALGSITAVRNPGQKPNRNRRSESPKKNNRDMKSAAGQLKSSNNNATKIRFSPARVTKRQRVRRSSPARGWIRPDNSEILHEGIILSLPPDIDEGSSESDDENGLRDDADDGMLETEQTTILEENTLTSHDIEKKAPIEPPHTPPDSQMLMDVDPAFSSSKRRLAKEQLRERLMAQGWSSSETLLAIRLDSRGREPLLPSDWEIPFNSLPAKLFGEDTVINSISGNTFRATHALERLFGLGARVRSNRQCRKPMERLIKDEIQSYVKWAERDGNIANKKFRPIIFFAGSNEGQDPAGASQRMEVTLTNKAAKYRAFLSVMPSVESAALTPPPEAAYIRTPPVLFGFLISRYKVAILTHDAADESPDAKTRCIGIFDFSDQEMDVWNAVAVAFAVIQVRDWLVSVRDAIGDRPPEADPDTDL